LRGDKKQTASAFKAFAMSMEEFEFEFEVIVQRDKQGGRCGGVDERGTVRVAYNDFVSGKASESRESVAAASLAMDNPELRHEFQLGVYSIRGIRRVPA